MLATHFSHSFLLSIHIFLRMRMTLNQRFIWKRQIIVEWRGSNKYMNISVFVSTADSKDLRTPQNLNSIYMVYSNVSRFYLRTIKYFMQESDGNGKSSSHQLQFLFVLSKCASCCFLAHTKFREKGRGHIWFV